MKYSGIGGQAVMEGVMMRNGGRYAVAVRKPDETIEVVTDDYKLAKKTKKLRKIPIIRGMVSFVDSLYLGMSTLMVSASFFEEEEQPDEDERKRAKKKAQKAAKRAAKKGKEVPVRTQEEEEERAKRQEGILMTGTVIFSVVFSVLLFFILPYGLSLLLQNTGMPGVLVTLCEGVMRLFIFIAYLALISLNKDIARTYGYHGAEHKCINCIEHGLDLNVDNVRASSREHKRCGTSFLLFVVIISIILFMFIQLKNRLLRLVIRLLLIPIIAGLSYEFIQAAGRNDNAFFNALSKPGLLVQRLTTREPDDSMIEVGIASVEAVFDWKMWQEQNLSAS